ncbi:uncharacterized protein LOC141649551 [Silene latifolia]|uniref:uncharacterized protein LOC141649551 n=1 Tax=Silene latifolia TaxID=37657 RepID=UPI003D788143
MTSSSTPNLCRSGVGIKLPLYLYADFTGVDFSKALIAKILDQRFLDVFRLYDRISEHWKLQGSVTIRAMKPYYIFEFSSAVDLAFFRLRQTVNIEGSLFVFRPVSPTTVPDNLLFHVVPLWIRVHHLPLQLLNTSVAAYLLSHVGDICEEESYPSLLPPRNFVRVKVWVDLSKPLIPGCYLALNDSEHLWIGFSYEGVFRFCKTCGLLGHRVSFCPSGKVHGSRGIRTRLNELAARGLQVLHGPPGSSFYTPEIFGLPPHLHYLNSDVHTLSSSDPVLVDSGGSSPVFSFSSSSSDDDDDAMDYTFPPDTCVHEDESREVLLENFPLIRGSVLPGPFSPGCSSFPVAGHSRGGLSSFEVGGPSHGGAPPRAREISPSFRMSVPEDEVDATLELGLAEPSTPPRSVDVSCLFRSLFWVPLALTIMLWTLLDERDDAVVQVLGLVADRDFNQIELFADKFGGSEFIRGQSDFTAWKIQNSLMDVPFFGPRFTWMNSQFDGNFIMERLDRAYATQDWFTLFPSASILHLPILVSDHAPILLSLGPISKSHKRPYRIDNWCLSYPEVRDLVLKAWETPFFGSAMFVVSLDEISASAFLHLRSSRLQLLRDQRQYWVQRSKVKSEILDGFPTRFLYNRVKQRSTKHHILALRTTDNVWLESPDDITEEIVTYFKHLLTSNTALAPASHVESLKSCFDGLTFPRLGSFECSLLQEPFRETKVMIALRGMDASKSPGPDGITPLFFHTFWPQIGHLVTSAILRFLNSGVMLKEWNNTLIVLIPKTDKPECVSQYRPISLCNVVYRLASKCMANRLKLVIPSLISESQQAFVPDRLMSDGCLIAHEIMHYINKTKKGTNCYSVIKLDMHKAFDRVSWNFLMSALDLFGFPISWRNLIWECISTVTYSIMINGEPSVSFHPSCGLRQRDPLSPYLFIMCMEILSRQLQAAESRHQIVGLKISRYAPPLSHLFYADDAFICCKATPASFDSIRDIFHDFEAASGQMINLQKSFIKFSPNSPADFKSHMTSILRMKAADSFGTYLGVPVDLPKCKKNAFHDLLDKITTRISSWASLHLSQPSKLVIINSILIGSLVHILAAVPLPLSVSKKLDSLIAAFLVEYRKDLPIPSQKSKISQPSFVWQGLCKVVATCSEAMAWKVGNGTLINLLTSQWVQGHKPGVRQDQNCQSIAISDLIDANGLWRTSFIFRIFDTSIAKGHSAMEPPLLEIDDFLHVWRASLLGIRSMANSNVSFIKWLADHLLYLYRASSPGFDGLLYFFCVLRSIWLTRNSIVFENAVLSPIRILRLAETLHRSHLSLASLYHEEFQPWRISSLVRLSPPNLNATFSYELFICRSPVQNGYVASVVSDSCLPKFFHLRASSLFAATSYALHQFMISQASSFADTAFIVSSQKLCSVLASQKPVPIDVRNSLRGIRTLLRSRRNWSVSLATG